MRCNAEALIFIFIELEKLLSSIQTIFKFLERDKKDIISLPAASSKLHATNPREWMWSGKEFNNSFNPSELSVGLKLMLKEFRIICWFWCIFFKENAMSSAS